jgi:methyltransferase family protein
MTSSLASWLALREAADGAARSVALADRIATALQGRVPVRIVDLGAGAGANVRYLAPRLPSPQQWLLVDREPELLEEARRRAPPACIVETQELNLGPAESLDVCSGRHLVTASALLDLVSEQWIQQLAVRCRDARAAVLFALTYDGGSECWPIEPEDDTIRLLLNRHQTQSDKGFGRAVGPGAADCTEKWFRAAGYHVMRDVSDWQLNPDAAELQRALIEGWASAAGEMAPDQRSMIDGWLRRRLAHVDARRSRVIVGHQDLIAWIQNFRE